MRINGVTYGKLKTPLKVNGNLKNSPASAESYWFLLKKKACSPSVCPVNEDDLRRRFVRPDEHLDQQMGNLLVARE